MHGTLEYLAQWQGLRGQDLDINLEIGIIHICDRTGQWVSFNPEFDDNWKSETV